MRIQLHRSIVRQLRKSAAKETHIIMTAIVLPALRAGETVVDDRARMTAEPAADIDRSATEKYFGRAARIHDIAAAQSVRKTSCPNGYPVVDLKISCGETNQ